MFVKGEQCIEMLANVSVYIVVFVFVDVKRFHYIQSVWIRFTFDQHEVIVVYLVLISDYVFGQAAFVCISIPNVVQMLSLSYF